MRILSLTVGLVLLTGTVHAQPAGMLVDVSVSKETTLGSLKVVEGKLSGPQPETDHAPHKCTVWVNGVSTQASPTGEFRVLIPNEKISKVSAYQPGYNILVDMGKRDLKRKATFAKGDEIRDLLNKPNEVASGGGDGGIRDLLNKPKEVASGGGDGGIRDLLAKPKAQSEVASGGGDGGIRDLLNKPAEVSSGGGDGGIRDLLNKPGSNPQDVSQGGGDGGIRDLLNKPPVSSGGGDGGIRDLLNKPGQGQN